MHILGQVAYEWDPKERTAQLLNYKKHGMHFANAVAVLEDQFALTMQDPPSENEERWISLGLDTLSRAVVLGRQITNGGNTRNRDEKPI